MKYLVIGGAISLVVIFFWSFLFRKPWASDNERR